MQWCRNHKIRNVLDELPKEQHGQTRNLMRAAWKVKTAEEGEKRLEQLARFLEREYKSAARSLREGMQEMFTLQRLQIPESLHKCLATTNVIESPQSGGGAPYKEHQAMARCRHGAALGGPGVATYRKIFPTYRRARDLWALAAILGGESKSTTQSSKEEVA